MEHGVGPAPERLPRMRWSKFLKAHWEALAAADFFTVEVWTAVGLVRYLVLVALYLATGRVEIAGIAPAPTGVWMSQVARNLVDECDGFLKGKRYLIHDWDPLHTRDFPAVGSEKPIAVRERLAEGPRDNQGRVAGGLMCLGDGPKKGQMVGLETRTGRHARLGYAMAWIRRTGRREGTFSVNRKIRLRAGRSGDGSRQPAHARLLHPARVAQPPGHQGRRHPMHGGSAKRGSRMRSYEAPVGDGVR
jgi:hypothetical protein